MKPLGLTAELQVTRPTTAEDAVWKAVEEARNANWSVQQFLREARESWSQILRDEAKEADEEFAKAITPRWS